MRLGIPVLRSMIVGVAAGLVATAAGAQQLASSCDGAAHGAETALASPGCAEHRFDLLRQGADGLGEEQFAAAMPGADGLRQQFIQADEDGDGRISRDEWLRWFGPAHAENALDVRRTGSN
jgi:EF hand